MNRPDGDIDTLANVITASGGVMVAAGLKTGIDTPGGLALAAIGRGCDLIDGRTARARNEDSDLGALFDAGTDKIACAGILVSAWRKGYVPNVVGGALVIQNLTNGWATAKAQKANPHEKLLPSKAGKLSMFAQSVSLLSYVMSGIASQEANKIIPIREVEDSQQQKRQRYLKIASNSRRLGHAAAFVGLGPLGIPATRGYLKRI